MSVCQDTTSSDYVVHLPNLNLEVDTSNSPVCVTMCKCKEDSTRGVTISKKSNNHHITLVRDKRDPRTKARMSDGKAEIDYMIISRDKTHKVNLKYQNGTWYLQRDKKN